MVDTRTDEANWIEQHFSKILTVRQSLSKATYRYVQKHAPEYQAEVIGQLSRILSVLLPKLPKDSITRVSQTFINNAVALKNSLAEERSVYQFFWVDGGEQLNPDSVETVDEERGVIGMCTFPGMVRKIKQENVQKAITVVKANAKTMNGLNRR